MGDIAEYYRDAGQEWLENNNYIDPDIAELHTCADGSIVCINGEHPMYSMMSDTHLLNTIKWIERKAENGVLLGGGTIFPTDLDMIDIPSSIFGEEVLTYLKYKRYIKEAKKRKLCQ